MKDFFRINKPFKKYLPVYMIMLSIMLLMGTSYALLRSSHQGENSYVMNVGLLEITFVDSETSALTLENAKPVTDKEGKSNTNELVFTVKNTGNVIAKYNVYIEETSTSPEFKTVIRFISNKNDTGYTDPKTLSEDKYIDTESYLNVGETATYKVKAWISETADATYMNQTFTARIVVDAEQKITISTAIKNAAKNKNSTCATYVEEDGITYISGTKDCIDFNYVWYSGKLWRITAIYPDGTMKMITDDAITTISYNSDGNVNFYTDNENKSYMYQWLNEDFLDTLYNYENIIVTDSKWNSLTTSSISTKITEGASGVTTITSPVGLLNSYEYYMSYKNTSYSNGYLNISYYWWLLNPYSASNVWDVNDHGYGTIPTNTCGGRPSINLKSGIQLSGGSGTKNDPYTILGDKEEVTTGTTLLNTRSSGEYVKFNNELYRIVGIKNEIIKINKNDYVRDTSNNVLKKKFSTSITYGGGTTDDYWDYYLNNTWYNALDPSYQNMIVESTYYIGTNTGSTGYKASICATASNTVATKDCEKTTSTWIGLVGLPRYGEMFASQQESGYSSSSAMWLMNPYSTSYVWNVYNDGSGNSYSPSNSSGGRPSINLKSNIKITGGNGTKDNPFEISE